MIDSDEVDHLTVLLSKLLFRFLRFFSCRVAAQVVAQLIDLHSGPPPDAVPARPFRGHRSLDLSILTIHKTSKVVPSKLSARESFDPMQDDLA